jgi:hypothetical protein
VPDCDTTACSFGYDASRFLRPDPGAAVTDFYAGYQVRSGANEPRVTVPLNDNVDYEGVVT